jgi:YHS domain-containing protein
MMIRLLPLVIALALALGLSACARSHQPAPAAAPAPTEPAEAGHEPPADDAAKALVPNGEAKVGDRTTCPVSKETFLVAADSPSAEHEGKTYYFCCPGCDGKFKADPKQYL